MDSYEQIDIGITDYTIFILVLCLSTGVGLYYGIRKKDKKSLEEYMFGSGQLPLIPVFLSNVASVVSSVSAVAIPRESYYYGAQLMFLPLGTFIASIFVLYFILPIFYQLKLISIFEYLERRFNKFTRYLACIFYSITQVLYILIIAYSAAKAVTEVLPIPFYIFGPCSCLVCTVYTALGGLRGVVWVDTVQLFVMLTSITTFICYGIYEAGGVENVINIYREGGRFDVDVIDMDPFVKYSPVSTVLAEMFLGVITMGMNQGVVQRYLSLPTYKKARIVTVLSGFGNSILLLLPACFGMVIYATYYNCDPGLSKKLKDTNLIVTFYILDKGKYLPGFTGLFLAGILSAAFSSMSTMLNSVSIIIHEDLIKPVLPRKLTASQTYLLLKCLVGIFGAIISFAVLAINAAGSIYQLHRTMLSLVSCLIIYVYIYGMFYRGATTEGALIGGLAGVVATLWLGIGMQVATYSGQIQYETKIVSIEGCTGNATSQLLLNGTTMGYRGHVPVKFSEDLPYPYRISFQYLSVIGVTVSVIFGCIISLIRKNNKIVDESLLIPQIRNKCVKYSDTVKQDEEMQQLRTSN